MQRTFGPWVSKIAVCTLLRSKILFCSTLPQFSDARRGQGKAKADI